MTAEIFKEVQKSEIPIVLQALKEDWPKHFVLHQLLTVLEDYKSSGCKWKHSLFLYGDYKNGVYLNKIEPQGTEVMSLYTDTTNPDLSAMKKCLLETKLIPWEKKKNFVFTHINGRYSCLIQDVFASYGIECIVSPNTMFWFPPNKDCKVHPLPEDTVIEFLDGSFAQEMNKNWPHKYPGSDSILRESLERNFGLGLFRKSDKTLMGSALSNHTGGIFVLFCAPEFRGRGYATILVQRMVQEVRRRGRIPFCTVILGNSPSEHVFMKTGFEAFSNADYLFPKRSL